MALSGAARFTLETTLVLSLKYSVDRNEICLRKVTINDSHMNVSKLTNYVIALAIMLVVYYAWILNLSFSGLSLLEAVAVYVLLFGDLLIECLITLLLVRFFYPFQSLRLFAYLAVLVYAGINLLQITSFEISSDFVTRLGMGNVEFVGLLVTFENVLIVFFAILGVVITPWLVVRYLPLSRGSNSDVNKAAAVRSMLIFAFFAIFAGVALNNTHHWAPDNAVDAHTRLLRENTIQRLKPVDQFLRLFKQPPVSELFPTLSAENVAELKKYGFVLNQDKRFPLLKDSIYDSVPPFDRQTTKKPNVIVIFTEGFSAQTSSVYSQDIVNITPNLEDYAGHSMVVNNYYNHTAATYRGLHGGLCSLFPKYGALGGWLDSFEDIPKTNYKCLTDVFRNNGYRSYYFDPHFQDTSGLDEMMAQLKFDTVFNADQLLPEYLGNEQSMHSGWLSDHQMYRSLVGFLEQQANQKAQQTEQNSPPFFLTLYSVETHAWVDVSDDGISYQSGKHNVLNTIHNMDDAFGFFWDYYKGSDYAKNTLIVFTSDHSHYYSNPYLKLMKAVGANDYQKLFIGQIPMIIHDPLADLPPKYDASYASSIDFAPTLIHLLGLPNEQNSFLGTSIFENGAKVYENRGVAAYGESTYLIDSDRIHMEKQGDHHDAQLDLLSRYIRYVQGLEIKNRLYP